MDPQQGDPESRGEQADHEGAEGLSAHAAGEMKEVRRNGVDGISHII